MTGVCRGAGRVWEGSRSSLLASRRQGKVPSVFGKRKRQRAEFEKLMAELEDVTAQMILDYVADQWDAALNLATVVEDGLKRIAIAPRMEICLYHVESIQLRIAYKRRDIEAIRAIARKSNNLEVSEQAFKALRTIVIHYDCVDPHDRIMDQVFRDFERELKTLSNAEGQIMRMRNPHPALIGTRFFPNLYIPARDTKSGGQA